MARREDRRRHHHHNQQLHYASILPAAANNIDYHEPHVVRRSTEQERQKALYIDFENAFQDQPTNPDYFGFQSSEQAQQNFAVQSVETISEIENTNLVPHIRFQAPRETSHSSTPPYQPRYNHNPLPSSSHHHLSAAQSRENLNQDFANLHINQNMFTADAIRIKTKQQETIPDPSIQLRLVLPQYFLVKYLGRTPCSHLWGSKAVRTPIDDMVHAARQLSSMNEIPTLEACVNTHGFTLTHRYSPVRSKHHHSSNVSPDRHQHGLVPLENISYVMHDIKYSKVASCIVLRQIQTTASDHYSSNETLTECYAFLFQSKEHARRFALALSEAFNKQKQSSRPSRQTHDDKREGRSPQRRSRHRNAHHHSRYDDKHLRDSEV